MKNAKSKNRSKEKIEEVLEASEKGGRGTSPGSIWRLRGAERTNLPDGTSLMCCGRKGGQVPLWAGY